MPKHKVLITSAICSADESFDKDISLCKMNR